MKQIFGLTFLWKISIIFLLGVIIFFYGFSLNHKTESIPVAAQEMVGTNLSEPSAVEMELHSVPVIETATSQFAAVPPQWEKNSVYTGGQEVTYQGKIYCAKWWTQGEEPIISEWGVWAFVRSAPSTDISPIAAELPTVVPSAPDQNDAFKVVAYYPSWKNDLAKIDFETVTHVNYAFAIPTADGALRPLENADLAKKLIALAHGRQRKVLLAVGGWSYNDIPLESTFMTATENDEKLKKFGDAILSMCDQYQFDGVDMDWEHPRIDGSSQKQYQKLMIYLGEKLHAKGKLLTSAVLSGVTPDGIVYYDAAAHSDVVLNTTDWINVMAYDGGDGERHSTYDFAVNSANYWRITRKLPAEKVVLGLPFYARPSWAGYGDILKTIPDAASRDSVTYQGMQIWYNGIPTIQKKTAFAKQNLGGVMIWEITQDTSVPHQSLLQAIHDEILKVK